MRLDKYIADTTCFSRMQAKRLIKSDVVRINGQPTLNPSNKINSEDIVTLHQSVLTPPKPRYFMLHKPGGYICATQDSENPTVIDLLSEPNKQRLQIAGRLDKNTSGLVLITDDGQWNHRITSPSHQCAKYYQVTLRRPLQSELIEQFAAGIQLKYEKKLTQPATLTIINDLQAELILQEGKYHQVKRMFAAVGNHVIKLHRSRIGDLHLDHDLKPGQYRPLDTEEINSLAP